MSQAKEHLNFMVVDDSQTSLTLLLTMVKIARVEAVIKAEGFSDPILAYENLSKKPALRNAIFSDFNMPGLNGVQFALKVRKIRPDIPVFICTMNPDECLEYMNRNPDDTTFPVIDKTRAADPIERAIKGLLEARKTGYPQII